jgi:hypothetical protein
VHVLQLFDSLVVGEDIEIVVAGLPERCRGEALGDGEFEGLECFGEWDFSVPGSSMWATCPLKTTTARGRA